MSDERPILHCAECGAPTRARRYVDYMVNGVFLCHARWQLCAACGPLTTDVMARLGRARVRGVA